MDDLVNGVVTTSVVLGGVVGIARTIVTNQRRTDVLRQVLVNQYAILGQKHHNQPACCIASPISGWYL